LSLIKHLLRILTFDVSIVTLLEVGTLAPPNSPFLRERTWTSEVNPSLIKIIYNAYLNFSASVLLNFNPKEGTKVVKDAHASSASSLKELEPHVN